MLVGENKVREVLIHCDMCAETETQAYTVSGPEGQWSNDLCSKHSEPLRKLQARGTPLGETRSTANLVDRVRMK
jgi:hypothetical protein